LVGRRGIYSHQEGSSGEWCVLGGQAQGVVISSFHVCEGKREKNNTGKGRQESKIDRLHEKKTYETVFRSTMAWFLYSNKKGEKGKGGWAVQKGKVVGSL